MEECYSISDESNTLLSSKPVAFAAFVINALLNICVYRSGNNYVKGISYYTKGISHLPNGIFLFMNGISLMRFPPNAHRTIQMIIVDLEFRITAVLFYFFICLFIFIFICFLFAYYLRKEILFLTVFICLFVCLFVSQQLYTKSYERISMKFSGSVGVVQETID